MDKQKQSSLDKNATYEEIFKSQHKVIDDRQLIDGVNELQVSSEFVFLPAVEQKYLEQYQLDSTLLSKLTAKVEYLSRKTKEIKQFIKESILHEQREYEPFVIKIQAWYRGCSCRKHLSSMGVKTFNKSRFYPDLPLAIRSAVKIQSVWRGVRTRQQLGDFKIQIVKSLTQTQHKQLKELNSEVFGLKNRIYELGESSQSNTSESEVKHLSSNIENLNEMYKMQQVQIDLLKETVQAQSVQVESMNTVITNQDATINDLNEKLVEKDVELKRFTDASLSQRNDLDMLKVWNYHTHCRLKC
ncbi:hypothetical protein BC833DRAFT_563608 [Globomyces pollinis-pini]|nr:hypothetical protein BC833DRAFT_563608 [Globomyces pollinis-pini]